MGVSIRAYARARGFTEGAVQKAIESKRITPNADGTIDPERFRILLDHLQAVQGLTNQLGEIRIPLAGWGSHGDRSPRSSGLRSGSIVLHQKLKPNENSTVI
jgi:hypothetical protein